MYLIALIVVFVLLGVFAVQNPSTQEFSFLGYLWRVPLWVPTAIGIGLASALLVLKSGTAGLGSRFQEVGHARAIDEHRDLIADLREENARLREEVAARRGELAGLRSGTPPGTPAAAAAQPTWRESVRSWGSRLANR
jgi:uncharacterized integral membrane protein